MAQDPYRYFRLEARDLLDQLSAGVLELEKEGRSAGLVQRLLRVAHTLKGAARVVKQQEIADRAHAIEDTLSPFRDSLGGLARAHIDEILAHLDGMAAPLAGLDQISTTETPRQTRSSSEEGARAVRTDVAEVDAVLDGVAATHALLNGLRSAADMVVRGQRLVDSLAMQLGPRGAADPGRQTRRGFDRLFPIVEELGRSFSGLDRNLGPIVDQMDRELRQLRDTAEQLRLVSAGTLFNSLERTARDSAAALSKLVVFEGKGSGIRLDAHVLGTIQGALVQIIRNAVAHGIESPSERKAAGKGEAGHIVIEVSRRGRRVVFTCSDDGRGVDIEAVRRVASQRGLLGAGADRLAAEDIVRLLLRGGITTSSAVTPVSGRGIGLDVVREAMERLSGEVMVRTDFGNGTTFELVVPPSLASMEALVVESSGTHATVPLDSVRGSLHLAAGDISQAGSGVSIVYENEAIPFIPLSRAIGGTEAAVGRNWTAVVLEGPRGRAAVGVDRLLGAVREVVRPLPEHVAASAAVAGASLDAEGNPQLVLDPDGLIEEAQRAETGAVEPPTLRHPVLVVDDSLTTRMLEQSILESAGYAVELALSAEDALDAARARRFSLFLVDIEMPGMDGFSFIERIRGDPALHDVPAILVTSRAAPEDRRRGVAVGAQGYVSKSEFDQAELLAMIKQLVG
jgi:two-component system chemotaxis sensor kinase CheA